LPRKIYSELERVECSQPWFEVYRIKRDVYAFYEPGQFEEVLSYLVLGKKSAALIDTGCGIGNVKRLAEEFTKLPIKVVNTHSHYDHVAQNHLFTDIAMFDAPNARQASKSGYSITEMSRILAEGMLSKPLPKDFDAEKYHVPPFTVTSWWKNGAIIALGDRTLEVVHTPGHTPGSIALLDEQRKVLFSGDTIRYRKGKIEGFPEKFTPDPKTAAQSIERLKTLDFDIMLSGHGDPLRPEAGKKIRETKFS